MRSIRIAARQSDLARLQAYEVGQHLASAAAKLGKSIAISYQFRSSLGDQRGDDPLWKMPEKGVFTEDFVKDLVNGDADAIVHSWKDLPIQNRDGTAIAATLARADARDILLVRSEAWQARKQAFRLGEPPSDFRVLTSSPRRGYCLQSLLQWMLPWSQISSPESRPIIRFEPVRGNIATRVGKIDSADALVVAKAALDRLLVADQYERIDAQLGISAKALRLKLNELSYIVLPLSVNPTAAAQGALAVEVRTDDVELIELCKLIDVPADRHDVEEERRILARYGGGCHQKIGVTRIRRCRGIFTFLRGETDAGEVLSKKDFVRDTRDSESRLLGKRIWRGEGLKVVRSGLKFNDYDRLKSVRQSSGGRIQFFVAREEAMTQDVFDSGVTAKDILWTAGLKTWRKLAARGIWVHGSSEGLGESEDTRLQALTGCDLSTIRLTHIDAIDSPNALGTYEVKYKVEDPAALEDFEGFFWKSKGQLDAVLSAKPDVFKSRRALHVVGPGKTLEQVRKVLVQSGWTEAEIEEGLVIALDDN